MNRKFVTGLLICLLQLAGVLSKDFKVYWNVPTEMCHKYGFNFSQLPSFGIVQNKGDSFKGDKIVILYDPGTYPAIINGINRNGGVPQEGNLKLHIQQFRKDLSSSIPNKEFNGLGIIDFEHWRPIWRENWAKLKIYTKRSLEIEKANHPTWSDAAIELEAIKRFEKAGFKFMDATLSEAVKLRPRAKWGYFAFPYCFNMSPKNMNMHCEITVKKDNDRSSWMYESGSALYPSAYLQQKTLGESKRAKLIQGRIEEGLRIGRRGIQSLPVLLYTRYLYTDTNAYLSKTDLTSSIKIPKKSGASGVIIWGSSKDVNTSKKCSQLDKYVQDVLRPILKGAGISA